MKPFFRKFIILTSIFLFGCVVPCASAFSVSSVTVDPSGLQVPEEPINVSFIVNFTASGGETFPSGSELQMSTELANPAWNWILILDGVENPRPESHASSLVLSGFELSYPQQVNQSIRAHLAGSIPSNPFASQKMLKIQEVDSNSNVVLSTVYNLELLVPVTTVPTPTPTPIITTPTIPPAGVIDVSSSPSGADVFLDNTPKGVTPTSISGVSPGIHVVRLKLTGYHEWSTNVTVYDDYTTLVNTTLTPTGNFPVALNRGWNFISIPKRLASGNNTAKIFNNVNTTGHSIWMYNASGKQWTAITNSTRLNVLEGIWIYSDDTKSINLIFDPDPLVIPPTKSLFAGWNAIGFSDIVPASAGTTLNSVNSKWSTLLGYNSLQQNYEPSIINKAIDDNHGDWHAMYPTKGYWVYMTNDGELSAIGA
jgi:hypothetical protein